MKFPYDFESLFEEILNADICDHDKAREYLATICAMTRGYGVKELTICYDGGYDNSDVTDICYVPEDAGLPDELLEIAEVWVWSVLPGGWEWDAGGRGQVTIDVAASRAHVEHAWYVVDTVKSYDIE